MNKATIVKWGKQCYITDEEVTQDALLDFEPFISQLSVMGIEDTLELVIAELEYEAEDANAIEANLSLIANNLVDMLNDDVVGLTAYEKYSVSGIEDRGKGLDTHIADIIHYYTANPFM